MAERENEKYWKNLIDRHKDRYKDRHKDRQIENIKL